MRCWSLVGLILVSCGGDLVVEPSPDAAPVPAAETAITEGPAEITASRSATFVFTSSVAPASFECRLDSAAFTACTPPVTVTVGEGEHVFAARAIGDDTPATLGWRVDLTPPETRIASGPEAQMAMSEASFAFNSDEDGSGFECALDGAAFAPCVSPVSFAALAMGPHSFAVRASDPAVNPDPSPATWSWSVAAITPETRFTMAPYSPWRETVAAFEFAADVDGVHFECQLDAEPRAACVSPASYDNLWTGEHVLQVWAIDGGGRVDPTPATHRFAVVLDYW